MVQPIILFFVLLCCGRTLGGETYYVQTAEKTILHYWYYYGSNICFRLNGVEYYTVKAFHGDTYTFISNMTTGCQGFYLTNTPSSVGEIYTNNVSRTILHTINCLLKFIKASFLCTKGDTIVFHPDANTPIILYYAGFPGYMGGVIISSPQPWNYLVTLDIKIPLHPYAKKGI